MTKKRFEERRRQALSGYIEAARREESASGSTRRQRENAGRRIRLCTGLLSAWEQGGFWTAENIRAYEMIYRHYSEDEPVSAF